MSRNLFDKTKIVQCKHTPIKRVGITLDQYKEYLKLKQELDNKNKVIALMAEEIDNYQICNYLIEEEEYRQCEQCEEDEIHDCKKCIIQYFESEV